VDVDAVVAAVAAIEIDDSVSDGEDIPGLITHVAGAGAKGRDGGASKRPPRRPWPGQTAPSDDIFALPAASSKAKAKEQSAGLTGRKFAAARKELSRALFVEYNARVFGNALPANLSIEWNAHLKTTAGMTKYKRVGSGDAAVYTAVVELSTKVLDDEAKLRRTLAHELCHAAAWLVDHVAKPPHGDVFRSWADRVTVAYPGIEVTTCHSYEIAYKYQYRCTNTACARTYGRHSKSIDLDRQGCGICRSRLELLGTRKADGSVTPARKPSAYAAFTKKHFADVKASAPKGTPHGTIMRMLSDKWKAEKERAALTEKNCTVHHQS
jgi:predicted SprT family Zn-dependent metalloprotease